MASENPGLELINSRMLGLVARAGKSFAPLCATDLEAKRDGKEDFSIQSIASRAVRR